MGASEKKAARYDRVIAQLGPLLTATEDPISRMATVSALLYHKMRHFSWIGFYRLVDGELLVGPYQGTLACQNLARDVGVCWAGINRRETIVVPDVDAFPGHIACDSRSRSEIVVPVIDGAGEVAGVLDGDSERLAAFDAVDGEKLGAIAGMIYGAG